MNEKVKGVFKGLRCISSIFDQEEKEPEIEIGLPTDVKHVSHIGFDGPTVDSTPSWMKEYKSSEEVPQSAPLSVGHTKENPGTSWDSEDLQRKPSGARDSSRDLPEIPKSTRHQHSNKDLSENTSSSSTTSPRKEKQRNSRRRSAKDLAVNSNSNRQLQVQDNGNSGCESSPPRHIPEHRKHYRRKKSKEFNGVDHSGSGRSRSKGKRSTANDVRYNSAESSPIRPIGSIMSKVSSVRSRS